MEYFLKKECSNEHEMKLQFGKQIRWRIYIKECRAESGIMNFAEKEASKLLHGNSISSMKTNEETSLFDSTTDGGI
ncbi:Hypothetical protein SRAE_0000073900 [Strongyloides ratti]|uniref:Uncharacterized protein n=1 Tax=Strongyloides ratti TaxID=34506 RepID=A0A090L0G8_STRRB|nr:Hypothetical protein SRAE_0000073900 [Strongyloides ratti]CEF61622.1 Hypothetical protein SRAE_0000073900 [Strongyloides ratti]